MRNVDIALDYTGLSKGQGTLIRRLSTDVAYHLSVNVQHTDEANFPRDLGTLANNRAISR